jgi:hypothetical protein
MATPPAPASLTRDLSRAIAAALVCFAGCGQGVLAGDAYDQPLFSFLGLVRPARTIPATMTDAAGASHQTNPIMGLLWTDPLQRVMDVTQPARGIASHIDASSDLFTIDVYGPPPPQAIVEVPLSGGPTLRLAYAEIVMFDDQNRDGTFQIAGADAEILDGDLYLAGANTVLVYLADSYSTVPVGNLLAVSGAKGYQLVAYKCDHQSVAQVFAPPAVGGPVAYTQPSATFPEVRSCARTHSP